MKYFEKLKKDKIKNIVYIITALVIMLHPIIELDYLIYPYLDNFGIPRITTIINFVILPLICVFVFLLYEDRKKRIVCFLAVYGVIFSVYFVLHCINANNLQDIIYVPSNFYFLISDEIIYTITLLLPLVYIWVTYKEEIKEATVETIVSGISVLISVPILLSNIFTFGLSTYEGYTIDNIFSWFSLPFNDTINHPRLYASKFFFEEGNTTGIIMFVILPLLYYFLYKEDNKIKRFVLSIIIFIQSISMIILSTRVATYGSFLVPIAMSLIYVFLLIIKEEKFKLWFLSFLVAMTAICGLIYPYSPAYQNQQIDAKNYLFQKENDPEREEVDSSIREGAEGLIRFTDKWSGYYAYMFEAYSYMIRVTPPAYYKDFYNYKYDPQFWVDLIFDYELEERINGRQIQTIFLHYKYDPLTPYQKALGLGYGTFMRGSMILERDFVQQYYSYGPIGFVLIMAPWLIITVYSGLKLLLGYKKRKWTFYNITLMMCLCLGLLSSYVSGHTLDELSSSLVIALCAGVLIKNLRSKYVED